MMVMSTTTAKKHYVDVFAAAVFAVVGIWAAIKGESGIASLIFFSIAFFLGSSLAPIGEVNPKAKDHMPDVAVVKRYREHNPGTSITEAINNLIEERDSR